MLQLGMYLLFAWRLCLDALVRDVLAFCLRLLRSGKGVLAFSLVATSVPCEQREVPEVLSPT
jgi:hypothetical protein